VAKPEDDRPASPAEPEGKKTHPEMPEPAPEKPEPAIPPPHPRPRREGVVCNPDTGAPK
jgi:hypothetical protein